MKSLAIAGAVGLLFMGGGFWVGLRLVPLPPPKKPVVVSIDKTAAPVPDAISLDTLRKTSQGLMDVNQALQAREHDVAAREKRAGEQEEELAGERAALDRSHEKFKELYGEFQQRLQLLDASELEQLQKQVMLYNSIDPTQAVDLMRAMDDASVTRLFSVMEVKPLSKLVSAWKAKYPNESARLLTLLNAMGRVLPKDKMISPEDTPVSDTADNGSAPVPPADSGGNPAPPASEGPAPATPADNPVETTAASNPAAPSGSSATLTTPDISPAAATASPAPLAPPVDASAPAPSATPDGSAPPAATDSSAPADTHSASAATPPAADSPDGVATAKGN